MTDITSVHHINFIFRDLDAAVRQFESVLGVGPFQIEELPERGARTARTLIGETWFVLVSPTSPDSVPGRYLDEHGEGFFLLSFGVPNLEQAIASLQSRDSGLRVGRVRDGAGRWRIADLSAEATLGIQMQLTADPEGPSGEQLSAEFSVESGVRAGKSRPGNRCR